MMLRHVNDNEFPAIFTDEEMADVLPAIRPIVRCALDAAHGDDGLALEMLLEAAQVLGLEYVDPEPPEAA